MSSEIIDLTIEAPLPEDIRQNWIPLEGRSVLHLFQFTHYPLQHIAYQSHQDLSQLLHEGKIIGFEPSTLLGLGPLPLQLSSSYQTAVRAAPHPIHSFTLTPLSGHPVKLPIWILDYWREITCAMRY